MAEHRVRKNNIIYIIPNDELYEKLINNEAFIDDYGRLMNRKPHRVLKELKHYVDNTPRVQRSLVTPPTSYAKKSSPVMDSLKRTVKYKTEEAIEYHVRIAIDKLVYEVIPNVLHDRIVPLFRGEKEQNTSKDLKEDVVPQKTKTDVMMAVNSETSQKMSKEEADAEKRKVLYHWLGMLSSLKKLHDAGEIDIDSTLAQLTDPVMLGRVNSLLSENPNLLETDKYIMLHSLLGRELYSERQLIPIKAAEITTIAEAYGYETKNARTEDNYNGRAVDI